MPENRKNNAGYFLQLYTLHATRVVLNKNNQKKTGQGFVFYFRIDSLQATENRMMPTVPAAANDGTHSRQFYA